MYAAGGDTYAHNHAGSVAHSSSHGSRNARAYGNRNAYTGADCYRCSVHSNAACDLNSDT